VTRWWGSGHGLLDDQVGFIVGWFRDTLADAPVNDLAALRPDGYLYESTIQNLDQLDPKLRVGGYCLVNPDRSPDIG